MFVYDGAHHRCARCKEFAFAFPVTDHATSCRWCSRLFDD
jgi:hypothetical protein